MNTQVTHVGCAQCQKAVRATELFYWKTFTDPTTGTERTRYFCSPECSIASHKGGYKSASVVRISDGRPIAA